MNRRCLDDGLAGPAAPTGDGLRNLGPATDPLDAADLVPALGPDACDWAGPARATSTRCRSTLCASRSGSRCFKIASGGA